MRKILVSGGAGFVGSVLVPMLLEDGYEVRVLDNLTFGASSLMTSFSDPDFELMVGDIRDENKVREALEGVDAVIHLAAIVGYPACKADPWLAEEVNYKATVKLNELRGDKLMVFASTTSNYGKVEGICTEETPLNPLSVYGQTKTRAEEAIRGKNVIILRFATAFGLSPRLRNDLLINNLTQLAVKNKCLLLYEPKNKRTFIHVKDMAESFIFMLQHPENGGEIFNVGDEKNNLTKEEIIHLLEKKVDFVWNIAEGWKDEDMRDYEISYQKIKNLGYQAQIGIEEGIDEMIKGYKVL
mgnify:CR=1 FL=1